ncbi:MAG: hypothetical protein LC104_19645 [Bacteroidales bacterium]|nr:hypothetical protein [Bacteroidales bacterium]
MMPRIWATRTVCPAWRGTIIGWMILVAACSATAQTSPPADPGLTVEGLPVDLDKLQAAITTATAGLAQGQPVESASTPVAPLRKAIAIPPEIPRAMPATVTPTAFQVADPGTSEALPPPQELPPVQVPNTVPTTPPSPPLGGVLTVDGVPVDPAGLKFRWKGGCTSCGGTGCDGGLGCPGSRHCLPGRKDCEPFPANNACERFIGSLYEIICCPDPCYEPYWEPLANAAFYVDPVRPATQTRLRWDRSYNIVYPDRAEYFWPRADGKGLGPRPYMGVRVAPHVGASELYLYQEAARGSFGIWTEMPYRNSDPTGATGGSGFGDLRIGTKSVLLDREMIQLTYQFTTYIPTGVGLRGLGTEHVSLEPMLIMGVKLAPESYLQASIAEWIPIGGDPGYAGAILHYHFSYNQTVWRPVSNVVMISTWELNSWRFQDGAYTDPVLGPGQKAGGISYFSGGPGVRWSICNKLDFGVGTAFALSYPHWAATQFRFEFRYRY